MSAARLTRKQMQKYEMWWFASTFGFTPAEYKAMSYSEREALKAVESGVAEARGMKLREQQRKQKQRSARNATRGGRTWKRR